MPRERHSDRAFIAGLARGDGGMGDWRPMVWITTLFCAILYLRILDMYYYIEELDARFNE